MLDCCFNGNFICDNSGKDHHCGSRIWRVSVTGIRLLPVGVIVERDEVTFSDLSVALC